MLQDRTWLLIGRKMANEASTEELAELEAILRLNPDLHFSMQAIADLWKQIPSHNTQELEEAYIKHLSRMKASGLSIPGANDEPVYPALSEDHRNYFRPILALAAGALIVIFSINYFTSGKNPDLKSNTGNAVLSEISTRYGSKTNIVLPDGTKVWLNAGSKLSYDKSFGETYRNVILTGEAYFDVVHNAEKPFLIHTHAMDIKVLGTEFNVKSYPEDRITETSLIRGSIEVTLKDRAADKIILKPNEKLVVTDEKSADVIAPADPGKSSPAVPLISISHLNYSSVDSVILETSWVQNRLVFEDESFTEIAMRMSRWYGVTFQFSDQALKNLRFTGNFQNETITEALTAMQITAQFKFKITNKAISISN